MVSVGAKSPVWGRAVLLAGVLGLAAVMARPVEALAASKADVQVASKASAAPVKVETHGSVYLFLGLLNVFSTGLDQLHSELKAVGIPNTAMNYIGWMGPAGDVAKQWAADKKIAKPIVLVGHSFGADAAIAMAAYLGKKGIPVDLIVLFDATQRQAVPANVIHLINYYGSTDGVGKKLPPADGFKGKIENIDINTQKGAVGHLNIEKQKAYHQRVIEEVLALYGHKVKKAGKN